MRKSLRVRLEMLLEGPSVRADLAPCFRSGTGSGDGGFSNTGNGDGGLWETCTLSWIWESWALTCLITNQSQRYSAVIGRARGNHGS
jgi:hypothetical protein